MWITIETKQLDDLWFATTQPLKNYLKQKKIKSLDNKSLKNYWSI